MVAMCYYLCMVTRGKSIDLAYAAGLFDGEGYITILRARAMRKAGPTHQHILVAGMSMTDRASIEWYANQWGGTAMLDNRVYANRKPIFMWRISAKLARAFILDVYPYLRIKKPQADVGLRFQSLVTHAYGVRGIPPEVQKQRNDLCEEIRSLNASRHPHPQRLSEGAPLKSSG